jgi:3D (Asp-Asp-Asp) domain-containing protein
MSVQAKIAQKRAELQERTAKGTFKKKHDPFLLWGEYPHGWVMIKDAILCIMLVNALIGQLKQVDMASLMASKTIVIANETLITPVMASTATPEPKAPQIAKSGEWTAYNSEIGQTDGDPYTMASGKKVYEGAIANNCLDFGTKVKVNGKVKIVEDRMNSRYGCENFDIYMESHEEAIKFGRQELAYEIIK